MVRPSESADAILQSLERLFKLDNVTHFASVELWVLLTTLLLVVRFLIDFKGPWFAKPRRTFVVLTLEILNQNMVIYTMGLMQLSGATKVNDYFQVWAVLLVTLQYSVKIGRPYTRSKQVPLLDLMSSFWSANLLRVQTFYLLRIPLWTIWSLNAVRIIMLFVSSGKGETNNQESMRLVSDYMIDEHNLPRSRSSTSTFDEQEQEQEQEQESSDKAIRWHQYKYLVYGEHRVLKQVHDQEGSKRGEKGTLSSCFWKRGGQGISECSSSSSYKIQLDPDDVHKKQLVTIETIWEDVNGRGLLGVGRAAERRRDLCLSFALFKLLRRRFYDLPMHEMDQPESKKKMRRLLFGYVLENRERAFRISRAELSFLQDLFYSKHATLFAGGLRVPLQSLLLSLCLAAATGYIAYPARHIPERMDPADRNRITHGVFITRLMVGIIVLKEMLEIVLYLWSRWAKVLMLCMYAQLQHRHPVVEATIRWFVLCFQAFSCMLCCWCGMLCCCFCFCFCCKARARAKQTMVCQQNLLVTVRVLSLPQFTWRMRRGRIHGTGGLKDHTKDAILDQLRLLDRGEEGILIHKYFSNAFGSNTADKVVEWPWPCNLEVVDTHIILVWHIATSLCEIYFFNNVRALSAVQRPRPFMVETKRQANRHRHTRETDGSSAPPARPESAWSEQYSTAVTLSNYCVYLVSKALVPDNRLIARKVLDEVIREIDCIIVGVDQAKLKLEDVYDCLMKTVDKPCKNPDHRRQGRDPADVEEAATPRDDHYQVDNDDEEQQDEDEDEDEEDDDYDEDLDIGCSLTRMGAMLGKKLTEVYDDDEAGLWEGLAKFWTGFLIHLAANTGAATHGRHLAGDSELITHLWALLTHAGYRGNAVHGEQGLDQEDVPDIDQEAAKS